MRNRTYGGVRGREMKVEGKLLHFPPTRLFLGRNAVRQTDWSHVLDDEML